MPDARRLKAIKPFTIRIYSGAQCGCVDKMMVIQRVMDHQKVNGWSTSLPTSQLIVFCDLAIHLNADLLLSEKGDTVKRVRYSHNKLIELNDILIHNQGVKKEKQTQLSPELQIWYTWLYYWGLLLIDHSDKYPYEYTFWGGKLRHNGHEKWDAIGNLILDLTKERNDHLSVYKIAKRVKKLSKNVDNFHLAVVGSRGYDRLHLVSAFVAWLPDNVTVVSGAAKGVDNAAENAARTRNLGVASLTAQWQVVDPQTGEKTTDRGAGMKRNSQIVDQSDAMVAFWDGQSRGTQDAIRKARNAGKEVFIIR